MYTAEMEKTIPGNSWDRGKRGTNGKGESAYQSATTEEFSLDRDLTGSQVPDRSVSLSLIGLLGDLERRDARCPSFLSDIHNYACTV